MLTRFAARGVNLTRIESRPTKQGLGDYCFVIEFEGHLADEIVGDCLRELHMITGRMKFLGSYPVPGGQPSAARAEIEANSVRLADEWLADAAAAESWNLRALSGAVMRCVKSIREGMAERTIATVLKTVVGASSPGVRIPLPPLVEGSF